jgi:hypothetical protein
LLSGFQVLLKFLSELQGLIGFVGDGLPPVGTVVVISGYPTASGMKVLPTMAVNRAHGGAYNRRVATALVGQLRPKAQQR